VIRFAHLATLSLLTLGLGFVQSSQAGDPEPPPGHAALETALADLCTRDLVVLGEDPSHGSGEAMRSKAWLVNRLVDHCGFDALAFEAQVYDLLALEDARVYSETEVLAAIGGLWSHAAEVQTLVEALQGRLESGGLRLLGIDPQIGGASQRYSQQQLPGRLAAVLEGETRTRCRLVFARLTAWQFDATHPNDAAAQNERLACMQQVLSAHGVTAEASWADLDVEALIAVNFMRQLKMADAGSPVDAVALRAEAMYENLQWHRKRLGPKARLVVWTANVHAARSPDPTSAASLGQRIAPAPDERVALVGISAASGEHRRARGPLQTVPAAAEGSIEALALAGHSEALAYLDRAALRVLGELPGRALRAQESLVLDWSSRYDGLLVVRQDTPPRLAPDESPERGKRP
jgi:erythromycin esterase-like protein